MQPRARGQNGFMLMVVILAMLTIALTVLVSKTGDLVAAYGKRFSAAGEKFSQIQNALVGFAGVNQRLPCPASPTGAANPGWPDDKPLGLPASTTCQYPGGIVPWKALGLSQEQVTDEWGQLISYRVYDGSIGLTQNYGASAVDCDTDNLTTVNVAPTTAGLCNAVNGTHDTLRSDFIFGKGLSVHDFGSDPNTANVLNVAYVLISHGPSGLGGYLGNGIRRAMPATDARDYANTQESPSFFIKQAVSSADTVPGTTGHYDDVVAYLKISDLLSLSGLDARNWPELPPIKDFDATTTAAMTSAGTDHFLTRGQTGAREFQQALGGAGVSFGAATGLFSSCLWWPNLQELYRPTTAELAAGTSWAAGAGGEITFATTSVHNFSTGQVVVIAGTAPSGYNGTYTIASTPSSTSFKVGKATDPGAWTSGGTVSPNIITGTGWSLSSGGEITFVTSATHNLLTANRVSIHGVLPTGYNGTYTVTGVPTPTSFTVAKTTDPGTWASGGTLDPGFRKSLMVSVDVAFNSLTASSDAGGGVVIGLLPHYGYEVGATSPSFFTVSNNSCGSTSQSRIGWENASTSTPSLTDGTLPSPRFGIEMDMQYTAFGSDPATETHIAISQEASRLSNTAIHHGSGAASCSSTANTYTATGGLNACYTGTSSWWLMDGLANFHKVRVEVEPMSATCGGAAPLVKYWVLPSSVCAVGSPPQDCTNIKDTTVAYVPAAFPAGGKTLSRCITTPTPSTAFDQVYFGFTTNNTDNYSFNTTENFRLTNLKSGQLFLP